MRLYKYELLVNLILKIENYINFDSAYILLEDSHNYDLLKLKKYLIYMKN